MKLAIKRLDPELPLPAYAHDGDAGLDLLAAEGCDAGAGGASRDANRYRGCYPRGLRRVRPRALRTSAARGPRCCERAGPHRRGYRGEIKVIVVNLDPSSEPIKIERGDKIAQLVIQRVERADLQEVAELPETTRGSGGFGSTGR